jgi:predicted RNA binding protein YcfA (HicA-like mRNA interferase family)
MKVRDVTRLLKDDGWYLFVTEGSYQQFKHLTKKGRVTVPGKPIAAFTRTRLLAGSAGTLARQSVREHA